MQKKLYLCTFILKCDNMALHNDLGWMGEKAAARHMRWRLYRILDCNWRTGHLEMDVICKRLNRIAFVEVKTRTSRLNSKLPEQYVDAEKQRHMVDAARIYMKKNGYDSNRYQIGFDVIGVDITKEGKIIDLRYYKDAFYPGVKTRSKNSFLPQWRWKQRRYGL